MRPYINYLTARFLALKGMLSNAQDIYGDLLGVDLDDAVILSVLLQKPLGTIRVARADVTALPAGIIAEDNIVDPAALSAIFKKMIEQSKSRLKNAAIAMPGSKIVIKQIKLESRCSDADAQARAWQEARKTFPEIVKNLFLDFVQVEKSTDGKIKTYTLFLVIARKEDIEPRVDSLQKSGLTPKIVDVDYYALARAYPLFSAQLPEAHADKYVALIDFNPHSLLFLVMHKKNALYYTRQVYTGDALVPLVQRAMGLAVTAVKNKPPFVLSTQGAVESVHQDGLTDEQKSHTVMSIRRLFQTFYAEYSGRAITCIALTGRCALIPEIAHYIEKTMDIPVIVANPLLSLKMSEQVNAENTLKFGPAFAVSCGLAMRGVSS